MARRPAHARRSVEGRVGAYEAAAVRTRAFLARAKAAEQDRLMRESTTRCARSAASARTATRRTTMDDEARRAYEDGLLAQALREKRQVP